MVLLSISFDRCLSFWVVVDRLGRLARLPGSSFYRKVFASYFVSP